MKKVLIACYGGGHVQSLLPVAKKLLEYKNINLTILGFTTAKAVFRRAGFEVMGYDSLLNMKEDQYWCDLIMDYLPSSTHPDISQIETVAYYALGLKSLAEIHGKNHALEILQTQGRKAFFPKTIFLKYLLQSKIDLVITSTSPRSELALQHAANELGIAGIAVSDLFLQHEASYICDSSYAQSVTVISEYVAEYLIDHGLPKNHEVYVTGNPAFDRLTDKQYQLEANRIRHELGISDADRIITWICTSGSVSLIGKQFLQTNDVICFLEKFCEKHEGYKFMIREHPSTPISHVNLKNGYVCPKVQIESCLHASDILLMETSTAGIQAALLEKPVITINAGDYPPYSRLGIATDVNSLADSDSAITDAKLPDLGTLRYPSLGESTSRVIDLVLQKLQ